MSVLNHVSRFSLWVVFVLIIVLIFSDRWDSIIVCSVMFLAVANDETWNAQIIIFMHLLLFSWMDRVQFSTHFSWLLLGLGNKNLYAETYWKVVIIFLFWLNSSQERHAYWWRPLHVYSLSFFYFNLPGKEKSWQEWKFPLIYSYIF